MEIWKNIPELNGVYQCSNFGRIRRINKDKRCLPFKILKLQITKDGYISVNPTRTYRKRVHRIVAELFIENPNNYPIINHIDCDKRNNHVDNLEWVTFSQNSIHAQNNNKLGRHHVLVKDLETNKIYYSIKDAAIGINVSYKYFAKKIKINGFYKNFARYDKIHSTKLYNKKNYYERQNIRPTRNT